MGAIEVRGLVREFKKGPRAVDGIDITVAEGEIYGFLGPNGAGKSTTVLMLTTLLPPTAGTATVAGFDIVKQGAEVRGAIGAALQEAALDKFLTGREHIKLQGSLHGMKGAELKASVGRSSVEIEPHDVARLGDLERTLAAFGTPLTMRGTSATIRLNEGVSDVAAIVRALDAEGIGIHQLRLREPTLDDVFLEQTGRSLEGSGDDEDAAE